MPPFDQPIQPPAPGPSVQTRQQLDVVLENIAQLQSERDELRRGQENEIAAVRQRYRAPLAEIENYLELETSWAETWARENPGALPQDRSLTSVHATIGFQAEPLRIERASRRWTWSRIAGALGRLPWGNRYLRIPPPEVNKEALLADLAQLSPGDLSEVGLKIVHGERFFITPHPKTESDWQQAA